MSELLLFDPEELKNLTESVLRYAKQLGATASEASISAHSGFSIMARKQEVEELIYHRNQGMGITLYNGQKKGTASCSDLTPDALKASVQAAWDIANQTSADPYSGLADPALLATHFPDLHDYYPWDISSEQGIALAKDCEQAALANAGITNSEGAQLSTQVSCTTYANSNQFCQAQQSSHHSLSCSVVAEREGSMQRDYSYAVAVDPSLLESPEVVGQDAALRTVRRLGARQIKTQSAAVIFAPEIARSLLGHFISAISGASLYRRASFLLDHLGQKIFPEFIDLGEQPYLLGALGSASFDTEGVATRAQDFIHQGILQRYVLNSYAARRLGLETTANAGGVHNLIINTSDYDLPQLLQQMGTGFFVTELLGQGANLITGDYSRGASGFWVEQGKLVYPVEGVTLSGNLKDIYQNIVAVGKDVDIRANIRTGSIWIASMLIGGA
jgi:PmbA protein